MSQSIRSLLFFRAWYYLLSYFEGILKAYVSIIVFGQIAILVAGSPLENLFSRILSVTPGIGLGKEGVFSINSDNIIIFFLSLGLAFAVVSEIINRFAKIKINISFKSLLLFGLVLHLVSLLVFSLRVGFGFAAVFNGGLLITYILAIFFLRGISSYKRAIGQLT